MFYSSSQIQNLGTEITRTYSNSDSIYYNHAEEHQIAKLIFCNNEDLLKPISLSQYGGIGSARKTPQIQFQVESRKSTDKNQRTIALCVQPHTTKQPWKYIKQQRDRGKEPSELTPSRHEMTRMTSTLPSLPQLHISFF